MPQKLMAPAINYKIFWGVVTALRNARSIGTTTGKQSVPSSSTALSARFCALYCKDNSSTPASVLVAQRHGVFH